MPANMGAMDGRRVGWVQIGIASVIGVVIAFAVLPAIFLRTRPSTYFLDLSDDPSISDPLPAGLLTTRADVFGRAINWKARKLLVIAGGSCAGCSRDAIHLGELPTAQFESIVVLYAASVQEVRDLRRTPPANVRLVSDVGAKIHEELNAKWVGRWYAARDGKLTDLQRSAGDVSWAD